MRKRQAKYLTTQLGHVLGTALKASPVMRALLAVNYAPLDEPPPTRIDHQLEYAQGEGAGWRTVGPGRGVGHIWLSRYPPSDAVNGDFAISREPLQEGPQREGPQCRHNRVEGMRDSLRDVLRAQRLRRTMRTKLQRAIQEVVEPPHAEQVRELASLRQEVSELRGRLIDMGELVRSTTERVIDHTRALEIRSRRDIRYAGDVSAARESAEFARDHLAGARQFDHPHATLEYALSVAPVSGMALEFGVYTGTTLKIIATARHGERVYGFDSFEGLPEHWRAGFAAGTFATETVPDVSGAELVPGWFDEVLPGFMENHPGPVDFLHVDADLYSSAATVLNFAGPRLREGSVVVFDEFFNYPGWQEHEYRAWTEYAKRTRIAFRYEAFTFDNEQVVVIITSRQQPRRPKQPQK